MSLLSRPFSPLLAALLLLSSAAHADGQLLGCFSAVPDSFVLKSIYTWQSSKYCANQCSGYDFFALTDGNACYCGSTFPLGGSDSAGCSQACVGFPSEQCGGASSYNILAQDGVDLAAAAAAASAAAGTKVGTATATTGTTGTTSSSSSSTSTTSTSSSSSATTANASNTNSAETDHSTSTDVTAKTTATPTLSQTTLTTATSTPTSQTTEHPSPVTSLLTTVLENSSATVTSIVYVTQSPAPSSSGTSSSSDSDSDSDSDSKSSDNKGAIIGGVVGGVLGLLIVAVTVLFLLRRRIFSGYYESHGDDNMLADDVAYEEAMKAHSLENPFASEEDKEVDNVLLGRRRLSDGSLADATDYGMKVLRVANPDDDD